MPSSKTKPSKSTLSQPARSTRLNRRRYWHTVLFFGWLFARALWWEYVVKRLVGESLVARGRERRMAGWSREFRNLAIQMTGVMIKLGQFVGSRADILPEAITAQLNDLQDKVPPERWDDLRVVIEHDLGPIHRIFAWVDEETQAAASIGQVHRAQLHSGERVVIKIQRPDIEYIVRTDLAALDVVARFAMNFQFIARRVNLPLLLDEFARVLWEELDYLQEAENAAYFAANFAQDPGVYVPATYPDHTTRRVLVMEDVTAIKITDHAAIEAAGISRPELAQRLLDTYLQQVFEDRFFHADPHPGNLFVYPLPPDFDGTLPPGEGRPFYLIFIDFGMTGHLTNQIVQGIRETLISVFRQDVSRMVASFQRLGIILPGADTDRIEEALRDVFDLVWGMDMAQMRDVAYRDMEDLARQFGDVLYELPFQVPQDFVYLVRALSILSGMCTAIDPDFNPWTSLTPYAQNLIEEETGAPLEALAAEVSDLGKLLIGLPRQLDGVVRRAERGDLRLQMRPTSDFQRQMDRLELALNQVVLGVVFAGVLLSSTLLYISDASTCGSLGFLCAGALLVRLLWRLK